MNLGELLEKLGCPPVQKTVSLKTAYRTGAVLEGIYRLFGIAREPMMTRFTALQLATSHWFDTSKARRDLEWEPVHPAISRNLLIRFLSARTVISRS